MRGFRRNANPCQSRSTQSRTSQKQQQVIRLITITQISSIIRLTNWKNHECFYMMMEETCAYIFPHPIPHDHWDVLASDLLKVFMQSTMIHDWIFSTPKLMNCCKNKFMTHLCFNWFPNASWLATRKPAPKPSQYNDASRRTEAANLSHLVKTGPFRTNTNPIFAPFKYRNQDLTHSCNALGSRTKCTTKHG